MTKSLMLGLRNRRQIVSLVSGIEGHDTLNKNVLRCCRNVRYDDAGLIVAGNAFHALAAATVTVNALSPSVI